MKIGFGVPVSGSWATPGNMLRVATRAEELGYHEVWTFQRLLYPVGHPMGPGYRSVHDPTVTMAYLAGVTTRIRLGVAVLNMPFASPALLAKQLATLQTVSGGRLDVGLGLGWVEEEFAASGVPLERRGKRGEEYVRVLRKLWTEDPIEFEGEFYTVPPVHQDPKPPSVPPILMGGAAPAALRRAGRLADGWISSSRMDLSRIHEQIDVVKEAAAEAGRDAGALRFICRGVTRPGADSGAPLAGSYEKIRQDVAALAEQGVTEVFHDLNFNPEIGSVDADPAASMRLAEEALAELRPAD
ncbi:LLM class F420-dependent oxidoreductase [Acrocarpospora phusangensis]|uniref:LLM class F420-dependent oxidoreductase n=1 Tax=Acrocarpospora phusangensis TaxID=1070424 RepID=A0A919Q7D1_9ACTN|nr:TIGR03619 family F420-dependent LLM class oxidoreductase [Acrocarpospora phusangensis]GIH23789.1 LLM class F420-dependent oxidoreductase [Acrocarpospora phusangensis]